jgi:lipoprotein-anchoring transpeptidase ErfK/SrfK
MKRFVFVASAFLMAFAVIWWAIGATHRDSNGPRLTKSSPTAPAPKRTAALPAAPAGSTLVATVSHTIQSYKMPGDKPMVSIDPTWHGAVTALPVIWAGPGWVYVRLAQRPNGSTAWVRDADVTLSSTPYRIVVNVRTTSLSLYKNDQLEFSAPAGVGTAADPTPLGTYFVAFLAAPPSPDYGPFVLVSSAHSNAISDWESSGDALMAIHGPLGADSAIATTGAHVSHGCVRLHVADLLRLRGVPAGTPIDVIDS